MAWSTDWRLEREINEYRSLLTKVIEALKYYVYLYSHPETREVFYVGKGRGNRVFNHLNSSEADEHEKTLRIRELRKQKLEPLLEVLIHGLEDEETALRVEAAVIDLLGKERLTNRMRGWGSRTFGRMRVDELEASYRTSNAVIEHPVLLIRINQLFRFDMNPLELYEATRGVWKLSQSRAVHVKYGLAVFNGIVREVYEIQGWFKAGTTFYQTRSQESVDAQGRIEFVGRIADEQIRQRYLYKSVNHEFPLGSQTPTKYVNVL
ncbi:MAG: hypothetical protein HC933_22560 [Pleurocapsa sp. SU_196_0]|nr:hypothetical protein [Pleurocapsa sp. SU_196_0]